MRLPTTLLVIAFSCLLGSCESNLQQLPTFSENKQLQMVVVTSAGSNHIQQYDAQNKKIIPALVAGLPHQVNFLPTPGNLGFIPSTRSGRLDISEKALEILVLAESQPAGSVQEVIPVATILLDIAGEMKNMVLAVPARPSERFLDAIDLASFTRDFPAARQLVHAWFVHYLPNKQVRIAGWKDEQFTELLIRKQML